MANTGKTTKKVMKKKLPEVKQTLTSVYRMVKANPLLIYKNDKKKEGSNFKFGDVVIPESVTYAGTKRDTLDRALDRKLAAPVPLCNNGSTTKSIHANSISNKSGFKELSLAPANINKSTLNAKNTHSKYVGNTSKLSVSKSASNLQTVADKKLSTRTCLAPSHSFKKPMSSDDSTKKTNPLNPLKNTKPRLIKSAPIKDTKDIKKPVKITRAVHPVRPKRRSLSADHYTKKNFCKVPKQEQVVMNSEITQSMENINNELSSIPEISAIKKTVTFITPKSQQRKSLFFTTPGQTPKIHTSTPGPVTKADLQKRLNDWLKKRGKSIHSFHHLKCFGVHEVEKSEPIPFEDDENKENIEGPVDLVHGTSYDDLKIDLKSPIVVEDDVYTPKKDDQLPLAKDALGDLHKLIIDGYSLNQCEAWLATIRHKYRLIEDEPQYWECRAAIEQTRGNLTSAVECYRTAIVKGAEVRHVDESLDHLLQKFSLLNLSTSSAHENVERQDTRAKNINEARHIFKSSIIQFAIQERNIKSKENETKKFKATPVRRSTRLSRSVYVSTPGIKICNSLHELDKSVRNDLSFKTNSFLA